MTNPDIEEFFAIERFHGRPKKPNEWVIRRADGTVERGEGLPTPPLFNGDSLLIVGEPYTVDVDLT